jgi:hypothetical protein
MGTKEGWKRNKRRWLGDGRGTKRIRKKGRKRAGGDKVVGR